MRIPAIPALTVQCRARSSSPSSVAGRPLRHRQRHAQYPAAVPPAARPRHRPAARRVLATPCTGTRRTPRATGDRRPDQGRAGAGDEPAAAVQLHALARLRQTAPERAQLYRLPSDARHRRLPFSGSGPEGTPVSNAVTSRARRIRTAIRCRRLTILRQLAAGRALNRYQLAQSYASRPRRVQTAAQRERS